VLKNKVVLISIDGWGIRSELEGVEEKDFWEIIDRGRNFEFMPASQRERLPGFFAWLGINSEEPSSPTGADGRS